MKSFLGSQVHFYSSFKERYNNNRRKNRFVENKRAESEKLLDKSKGESNEDGENKEDGENNVDGENAKENSEDADG